MDILGSIGKALTDPGAIAQEAVGNFLPKEISGVLGNVVAGAVDLSTGNERQALQHALQGLADLPQLTHSAACSPSPGGSANFEPGLPPGGAGNMVASGNWRNTTNLQQLLQQILQALHGNNGNVTININTNPGQAPAATGAGNTAPSAPANGASSSTAPGGTTSSSGTTAPSDTSPASSGAVVANNDGKYDMKSLDAMNNTDFMNAIRDGKISDAVAKDPAAMRAIQARMDQITQMNQLMTSMLQAMHQMEMSIIQNIRV
jgi:hypothetical protein